MDAVEGFEVRFSPSRPRKRSLPTLTLTLTYEFRALWAGPSGRVSEARSWPHYPDYDVEVLNPDGRPAHGKTLLSTLREGYWLDDVESAEDSGADSPTVWEDTASRIAKRGQRNQRHRQGLRRCLLRSCRNFDLILQERRHTPVVR